MASLRPRVAVLGSGLIGSLVLSAAGIGWLGPVTPTPSREQEEEDAGAPEAGAFPALDASEPTVQRVPATEEREESAGAGDSFQVHVLRDGRPVPGAEVRSLSLARVPSGIERGLWEDFQNPSPALEVAGRPATTDAEGRARVPRESGVLALEAHDGTYGARKILPSAPEDRVTLSLERRETLELVVLDPAGRPVVGIPVALSLDTRRFPRVWHGATDADGTCSVPFFDLLLELLERREDETLHDLASAGSPDLLARVDAPFAGATPVPVPRETPAGPLVLRVPWTGSVELALRDPGGALWPYPETVQFHLDTGDPFERRAPITDRHEWNGAPLRIPWVEVGQSLLAWVICLTGHNTTRTFAGPTLANAVERVEVPMTTTDPVAIFRAVGPDGTPLAHRRFSLTRTTSSGYCGTMVAHAIRSDDRAELRIPVRRGEQSIAGQSYSIEVAERGDADVLRAGIKDVVLPALGPGEHFLGELVFGGGPLLLAGSVTDPAGHPVPGVPILARSTTRPEGEEITAPASFWSTTRTDDAGRFAFHGDCPTENVRWGVMSFLGNGVHEVGDAWHTTARGTPDVTAVVQRGASLRGTLLVDDHVPRSALRLSALPREPARRTDGTTLRPLTPGFSLEPLRPGTYVLQVTLEGQAPPLWEGDPVDVVAATETLLPPVDLRGACEVVELTVVDPMLRPVSGAKIYRLEKLPVFAARSDRQGRARVVTSTPLPELAVLAEGFRLQCVAGASGRVVLRAPLPVELRMNWPEDARERAEELLLEATVSYQRMDGIAGSLNLGSRSTTFCNGVATFELPDTGDLHVNVRTPGTPRRRFYCVVNTVRTVTEAPGNVLALEPAPSFLSSLAELVDRR